MRSDGLTAPRGARLRRDDPAELKQVIPSFVARLDRPSVAAASGSTTCVTGARPRTRSSPGSASTGRFREWPHRELVHVDGSENEIETSSSAISTCDRRRSSRASSRAGRSTGRPRHTATSAARTSTCRGSAPTRRRSSPKTPDCPSPSRSQQSRPTEARRGSAACFFAHSHHECESSRPSDSGSVQPGSIPCVRAECDPLAGDAGSAALRPTCHSPREWMRRVTPW